MTLRLSVQSAILKVLEDSGTFVPTDFALTTEAEKGGTKLILRYRFADAYFQAVLPSKQTREGAAVIHDIGLAYRPGRLNLVETGKAVSEHSLLEEIKEWAERLGRDLMADPIGRQVADHEAALDDLYKRIGVKDDDVLDNEEAESLIERIRALEKRMAEGYAELQEHKTQTTYRIQQLHKQVEALIRIVSTQKTKKGVIRAIVGRIFAWSAKEENQKLLQDVGSTVAGLLSDGK